MSKVKKKNSELLTISVTFTLIFAKFDIANV